VKDAAAETPAPPVASTLGELAALVQSGGLLAVPVLALQWLLLPLWRRRLAGSEGFVFAGRRHDYAVERYRLTWTNERAVELPLAFAELAARPGQRILEVGNVLAHYGCRGHRVIDKYERAPGVENIDVLDLAPSADYDLVLSVSTLEHVGWDEEPRDPSKAAAAVAHLKRCLKPGGRLWMTLPLGYNPPLDAQAASGALGFSAVACLQRVGTLTWRQAPWDGSRRFAYGAPFRCANAVLVATFDAPGDGPAPASTPT
jgi:SAM-dependent methyltransferase